MQTTGFNAAECLSSVITEYRVQIIGRIQKTMKTDFDSRFSGEDIYQQACAYVSSNIHKFRGTTRNELAYWLGLVAQSTMSNEMDKANAAKRSLKSTMTMCENLVSASVQEASAGNALNEMAEREEAEAVVKELLSLVDDLPERQRMAIHLRFFSRLSFEEVAERMDTTKVAAKGCVKRGLQALRNRTTSQPCLTSPVISVAASLMQEKTVA